MASIESKIFYFLLRLLNKKKYLQLQFAVGRFDFYNSKEPPKETLQVCNIDRRLWNGRNVFTLMPKTRPSGKHIFYLHGGAYVQNFVKQHWKFLSMLVKETHCTITAPDYPLAPTHTYRDAFDMIMALYRNVIDQAGSANTILMGDSAGGGLALAVAQEMKRNDIAQPGKIILLSPWLDIALTNPAIEEIDALDPFLDTAGLKKAGKAYAGNDGSDSLLSPVNGPLEGLGWISIFIGTNDILVADTRKLHALAKQKGISINYREYEDMVHVWMLLNFPESRAAKREIIELVLSD